jgi:hypothetical protein
MKLTDHFNLNEFTASQEATRHNINNTPSPAVVENLRMLAALLEQVRTLLGGNSIRISSGYRSLALNRHIGSSHTSAHIFGYAADFTCPAFGTPLEVAKKIAGSNLKFDQMIYEGSTNPWVHISCDPKNRRQLLTASFKGGKAFYKEGIA